MALTTAGNVRELVTGLPSDATTNTLLGVLIARAGVLLARFCGYPPDSAAGEPTLESTTYTRYFGDPGLRVSADGRSLYLEPWPVTAITTIHDDPDEAYGDSTLVAAGDYNQRGEHGDEIRLEPTATHGRWGGARRGIKAVFVAGYSTTPASLKQAAAEMVAHLYLQRHRRGLASEGAPDLQTVYRGEELPLAVRQMLARYRLASVYL